MQAWLIEHVGVYLITRVSMEIHSKQHKYHNNTGVVKISEKQKLFGCVTMDLEKFKVRVRSLPTNEGRSLMLVYYTIHLPIPNNKNN